MSPFRPERLYVSVERGRIAMVRCRGWLRRQLVSEQVFAGCEGGADTTGAIGWLGRQLAAAAPASATAHVVLSDQLVKSFVFERVPGLRHLEELKASISARFEEIFGLDAGQWEISADLSPFARRFLVCAVERSLPASLRQVFGAHRIAIASVQPFFVSEFNRWRHRFGKGSAWFAVLERDGLTLARLADGSWGSVRTHRTSDGPAADLPRLLARDRLTNGIGDTGRTIWLAGMPPAKAPDEMAGQPGTTLGEAAWPGRTLQWSRDYRLALSGIWP